MPPNPFNWSTFLAGLISTLGQAFGINWTNNANVQMQRENNQLQQQLAGQANQWNIDQWNRENAYNLPTAQRARLEAAGLNPGLVYGGGLMNEAAASPQATMANTEAAMVQNPMEHLDPLTAAQVANLNADTHEKESRVPVNQKQAQVLENTAKKLDTEAKRLGIQLDIDNAVKDSVIASLTAKNELDAAEADAAKQFVNDTAKANFDKLLAELDIAKNKNRISQKEFEKLQEELKSLKAKATIDEYAADNKEADFWLSRINNEYQLIALGLTKYRSALDILKEAGKSLDDAYGSRNVTNPDGSWNGNVPPAYQ